MKQVVVKSCIGMIATAALMAAAFASPANAQNLLLNPGFEDGDFGPINGSGNPTNWYAWGAQSGYHHGDAGKVIDTKAIKFWWDDVGVWQDVTVTGGEQYDFSVLTFSASGDALRLWNGVLKAEFYNSALGTDSAHRLAEFYVDKFYSASDPTDQWVTLNGIVTAPANADIGRMILMIGDWQSNPGGSLNFDNASITLVPEPASLLLLGLGVLAVLRRRH